MSAQYFALSVRRCLPVLLLINLFFSAQAAPITSSAPAVEPTSAASAGVATGSERADVIDATSVADNAAANVKIVADAIYFGGDILTMLGQQPSYIESVATKDKKIIFAGSKVAAMELSGDSTKLINISGKTLLPGFIDSNVNPTLASILLSNEILASHNWTVPGKIKSGVTGHFAYLQLLKEKIDADMPATNTLFVWGYQPLQHGELSRTMLNELSATKPVIIFNRAFNSAYVNDAAIAKYNLQPAEFVGLSEQDWRLGLFTQGAWLGLLPRISADLVTPEKRQRGLHMLSQLVLKNGITTIADTGFSVNGLAGFSVLDGEDIVAGNFARQYQALKAEMNNTPPYDVLLIPDASSVDPKNVAATESQLATLAVLSATYNTGNIKFLPGQVKLTADGDIYARGMQIQGGYADGHQGVWQTPLLQLQQQLSLFWQHGYQLHVASGGELAVGQIIEFNRVDQASWPRQQQRLVLTGVDYATAAQMTEIAKLGIAVVVNPYHYWAVADKYAEAGFTPQSRENLVRLERLAQQHIAFSFQSDFVMTPMQPLTQVWMAVNQVKAGTDKADTSEGISVYKALQAITINAARSLNMADQIGAIQAGSRANFTLLEQNPLKVTPAQIKDIPVWGVVFDDALNTVIKAPVLKSLETRVLYLDRELLPPSSTITVTLEDISKVSISSSILGQKTIVANVAPPYNISIQYDPSLLTADGQYVLKARIEHEGKPLYSSIYPIPALSELSGQVFELIVNATPQPAAEGVDDIHPQLPVPPAE